MPRVVIWPAGHADRDGSAFYRLLEPARCLAAQGADVHVDYVGPTLRWDRAWEGDNPPPDARVIGAEPYDADVVVLQRPGRAQWAEAIPHLQAHGVRVVVDVDDHFGAIHPGNTAHDQYDPVRSPRMNRWWIQRAAYLADAVTVSTAALASVYAKPRGGGCPTVLPNLIPAAYLDVAAERLPDTVGWTGSVATHPADLESTAGGVARALTASGWRMHVVGTGAGVRDALRLDHDPTVTGWVPLPDYPKRMAQIGVGVVPLALNRFNRAKSALKMSEFAALGVPVVASPTPDNSRLNRMGVGFVARTGTEWEAQLCALAASAGLRDVVAEKGRSVMAGQTYELHAGRWWDAWTGTLT